MISVWLSTSVSACNTQFHHYSKTIYILDRQSLRQRCRLGSDEISGGNAKRNWKHKTVQEGKSVAWNQQAVLRDNSQVWHVSKLGQRARGETRQEDIHSELSV